MLDSVLTLPEATDSVAKPLDDLTVIIPAFNEAEAISRVLADLAAHLPGVPVDLVRMLAFAREADLVVGAPQGDSYREVTRRPEDSRPEQRPSGVRRAVGIPVLAALLVMAGLITACFGLLADQVSSLRKEMFEKET